MKEACLSDNEKVVIGGVRFFLGGDKEREELEDESSDEDVDIKKVKHQGVINKKTKKRQKAYEKALEKIKKYAAHPSVAFPTVTDVQQTRTQEARTPSLELLGAAPHPRSARIRRAAVSEALTEHQEQVLAREQAAHPPARDPSGWSAQAHHHLPLLVVCSVLDAQAT